MVDIDVAAVPLVPIVEVVNGAEAFHEDAMVAVESSMPREIMPFATDHKRKLGNLKPARTKRPHTRSRRLRPMLWCWP